jgi:hypothetical protein
MKRIALFGALGLFLLGCNPSGTCMVPDRGGEGSLGDQCMINFNKNACATANGEFFAEDGVAGTIRCKSAGYGDRPGSATSDPKALRIYYKGKK